MVKDSKDLNPFLLRFLKSVYSVQVSHLHEKFTMELNNYLKFLLQFANGNYLFRNSVSYSERMFDKIILDTSKVPLIKVVVEL